MDEVLRLTPTSFKRYLYYDIDWNQQLIGIVGARGVGKSTMMKQYILDHKDSDKYLYVSADNLYFTDHTLAGLADEAVKENITHLFIDEIHKYPSWSVELKQIYDIHKELKVVFTGSSVLDVMKGQADLSRRAVVYHLFGLSFREYLSLFHSIDADVYNIEEILGHKVRIETLPHPLPLFRQYLKDGYYPFALEGLFDVKMQNIISQSVESDIAQYAGLNASTARKLKRLLSIISALAPYKPNASNLSSEIGVSKNNIQDYLVYLEKAGLIGQLRDDTGGLRGLGKVDKVYLDNANIMYVLSGGNPNIGNMRETFFFSQMKVRNDVISSKVSDFVIGKYTFEVGGRKKGKKQIEDVLNGFVVKDDIETGHGDIIPLWQFGLNY